MTKVETFVAVTAQRMFIPGVAHGLLDLRSRVCEGNNRERQSLSCAISAARRKNPNKQELRRALQQYDNDGRAHVAEKSS